MKKYKCIRAWARNEKGDVITEFQYKQYPASAKQCFEEIVQPERVESKVSLKVKVQKTDNQ